VSLNFSYEVFSDPCQKNAVYGGVECTGGTVTERMSACIVLREKEKKRRTNNVWPAKEWKEIFWIEWLGANGVGGGSGQAMLWFLLIFSQLQSAFTILFVNKNWKVCISLSN